MPSTHLSLHCHVVFSTKERNPLIDSAWRMQLHAVIGDTAGSIEAVPEAIGGTSDHVHVLLGLRAVHRLSDVVRVIKTTSSEWVHTKIGLPEFRWQDGYGAFTVSPGYTDRVKRYISNQEAHHHALTFQDEYLAFLKEGNVEFDPRYLW